MSLKDLTKVSDGCYSLSMQTLNLSTHCLECLENMVLKLQSFEARKLFSGVTESLRAAPKFLLPDGGRVMEDENSVSRLYDQMRLPFACVALEYEAHGAIDVSIETRSSKRIALCWDLSQGVPAYLQNVLGCDSSPRKTLAVQSLSFLDDHKTWLPIMGLLTIDLDEPIVKGTVAQHTKTSPEFVDLTKHRFKEQRASTLVSSFSMKVHPYLAEELTAPLSDERNIANLSADSSDELLAMISFAALTSCANVEFDVVPAVKMLNKKRAAKGKEPFYDVRVLMLSGQGYQGSTQSGGASAGAAGHASPRTHLRRGHVRRLPEKNVWVNASVINASAERARTPSYKLV